MSDDLRSLREHLADERLYADASAAATAHTVAWRGALLARYPERMATPPVSREPELRRLVLLVALPMALGLGVAVCAMAGFDFTPRLSLPAPLTGEQLERLLMQHRGVVLYFSFGLAGLSTLLTFLVRGRVPRLLPLDW